MTSTGRAPSPNSVGSKMPKVINLRGSSFEVGASRITTITAKPGKGYVNGSDTRTVMTGSRGCAALMRRLRRSFELSLDKDNTRLGGS